MIFNRRAIQRRLTALRDIIRDQAVDDLLKRLNGRTADSAVAEWKWFAFTPLTPLGRLSVEQRISTGKRPDVAFEAAGLLITADIERSRMPGYWPKIHTNGPATFRPSPRV